MPAQKSDSACLWVLLWSRTDMRSNIPLKESQEMTSGGPAPDAPALFNEARAGQTVVPSFCADVKVRYIASFCGLPIQQASYGYEAEDRNQIHSFR